MKKLRENAPLFAKLQMLAGQALERFKAALRGFDIIGLNVGRGAPTASGDYWCSPINSKCFASTGGGGVHFSFVAEEDDDRYDVLPVVLTIPCEWDKPNLIVGENLYEFLSLGCYRGFFALEQLAYRLDKTLEVYADPNWKAESHDEFWVGFGVDDTKREVLDFLRGELQLRQWPNVRERFQELQVQYMPCLRLPDPES